MLSRLVRPILFFMFVILLTMTAWAQHGGGGHGGGMMAGPPAPEAIEVPAKGISLPMQDFGGRTVVDVKINGHGPYRFVLGTAATMTIIDSSLHRELSFPAAEGVQVAPVGGQTPLIVTVQELRVGGAVVRGFIAAVTPLKNFQGGEGMPRGIVSASLFQGYLLTFDYPRKRITIEKGKLDKGDEEGTFDYSENRPTVPIRIAGQETRVRLDTGSGYGLTLPSKFAKELPLGSQPKDVGKTRTVAGDFSVSKAAVKAPIELGRYKLDLAQIYFSDTAPSPSPGNIGYEVLRNFVVTLDTWNRRIRFAQ